MVFVGDEDVERRILESIQALGHSVVAIAREASGSKDPQVLELARQHEAILITKDKGFGQLVVSQGQSCRGLVLLRLAGLKSAAMACRVVDVIETYGPQLEGSFTVVKPLQVRIRPLLAQSDRTTDLRLLAYAALGGSSLRRSGSAGGSASFLSLPEKSMMWAC